MNTDQGLGRKLASIDRRGYPAYKSIRGVYDFGAFELSVDHVQGDPFAAPSQLSVYVSGEEADLPSRLYDALHRRVTVEDLLVRRFADEAHRMSFTAGGSGKSGLIASASPGPEVLARSACEIDSRGGILLRFEAGLPAHGRTIDGRAAAHMLLDLVPACVEHALLLDNRGLRDAQAAAELADDQQAVRDALQELDLVAFVADGSVLPRTSGVSSRPLKGARPFTSPASLRVTLTLPHRGEVSGMGIRRGVTLVVGGGYHGKSTLLKALQEGVYNHVAGDGRELVITDATAVKLRAEDGRIVRSVDISPFINNLPDGRDTTSFSTDDASGSTSQAASTVEALEAGARVLLIDEDTSATNFMVRDELMEAVVAADREPISPFVDHVRELWERDGVSTVLVVGSSGAFFPVADCVIQMDTYEAHDITERVRAVLADAGAPRLGTPTHQAEGTQKRSRRVPRVGTVATRKGHPKVRAQGLDGFSIGDASVDLRQVEQLVDAGQVATLAQMVRLALGRRALDGTRMLSDVVDETYDLLDERGWSALAPFGDASCSWALPRPQELFAALNRLRMR